jgi:hypothetical protein
MSWLSKAAQFVVKIIGVVTSLDPVLQYAFPGKFSAVEQKVASELTAIAGEITNIEAVAAALGGAAGGPDKLRAAVPYIAQIIQSSEMMVGKKVKDEAKFTAAIQGITSNFADLLNSLEAK